MSSLWVYLWLKWGPVTSTVHTYTLQRKWLPRCCRYLTEDPQERTYSPWQTWCIEYSCKITNKRKTRDGVMGGLGWKTAVDNQTIVLHSWALSKGMVSICSPFVLKDNFKKKKGAKTHRIAHVRIWKMQSNKRSRDSVWCGRTMVYSQTPFSVWLWLCSLDFQEAANYHLLGTSKPLQGKWIIFRQ